MTREEARNAANDRLINAREEADIMMAYADGKTIEYSYDTDNWLPCEDPVTFDFECCYYRIQPTMIYRPFVNSKECFDEMKNASSIWVGRKQENMGYPKLSVLNQPTLPMYSIYKRDTLNKTYVIQK